MFILSVACDISKRRGKYSSLWPRCCCHLYLNCFFGLLIVSLGSLPLGSLLEVGGTGSVQFSALSLDKLFRLIDAIFLTNHNLRRSVQVDLDRDKWGQLGGGDHCTLLGAHKSHMVFWWWYLKGQIPPHQIM